MFWFDFERNSAIGQVTLASMTEISTLVPTHLFQPLQLIWTSGTRSTVVSWQGQEGIRKIAQAIATRRLTVKPLI